MSSVSVSAPGKAVIAGEYAVLVGAPAISIALDRRAVVTVAPVEEDFHRVTTPGYMNGTWRFRADEAGAIHWIDALPAAGMQLVEQAWQCAAKRTRESLSLTVDTREFSDAVTDTKLGIGSSAAAMTALVGALCQYSSVDLDREALSHRAHAALQGGLGSGVDIATSFHGGVIEYRMQGANSIGHHAWPDNLHYRVLWSRKPVSTRSRIASLNTSAPDSKAWADLVAAAERVAINWATGKVEDILAVVRAYTMTLKAFSEQNELDVFAAGHGELLYLASTQYTDSDLVYKPCGAGGGDIGIVMSSSARALTEFCSDARKQNFLALSANLDFRGVDVVTKVSR